MTASSPLAKQQSLALAGLSDPTRRAIVDRLRSGPASVGEIASGLPVSRPAVSQHLKVLEEAGLVQQTRQGARRVFRVDPDGVLALRRYLDALWEDALTAFAADTEDHNRRPDDGD